MNLGDIRAYVERDWQAASTASGPEGHGPEQALRAIDAARTVIQAANPDWPGQECRAADLEHHIRVAALIRRGSR